MGGEARNGGPMNSTAMKRGDHASSVSVMTESRETKPDHRRSQNRSYGTIRAPFLSRFQKLFRDRGWDGSRCRKGFRDPAARVWLGWLGFRSERGTI